MGVVGWLTVPRPEGDYAIAGDANGYALLAGALIVFVTGVATLPRRVPRDGGPGPS